MKKLILLGLVSLLSISSCKKYPENPYIVLYPRGERIEGKWKAKSVKINDVDSTTAYKLHTWEFTRNSSVILQIDQKKRTGIWTTGNNDKDFIIEYDNGERITYEIRKLRRKEFWIKDRQTQLEFQLENIK
jgi:hypothetical protein